MQPIKIKTTRSPTNTEQRQMEAVKTSRLRALRLAKEAADRETAIQAAGADRPRKSANRVARRPAGRSE